MLSFAALKTMQQNPMTSTYALRNQDDGMHQTYIDLFPAWSVAHANYLPFADVRNAIERPPSRNQGNDAFLCYQGKHLLGSRASKADR